MEQYLYRIQPTRPEMLSEGSTEREDKIVEEHFYYLQNLRENGVVKLAGRTLNTDPSSHGIVIFEVENMTEAQKIMDNDPAVRAGVFSAELFPFRVALENFS